MPAISKPRSRSRRKIEDSRQTEASPLSLTPTSDHPTAFGLVRDKLGQGLCVFDDSHRLTRFNRCFAEMYGIVPDALQIGMSLPEVIDQRFAVGTGRT